MRHLHICDSIMECSNKHECGLVYWDEEYLDASMSRLDTFLDSPQRVLETVTCPACLVRADEILEKGKL